jgi:phenylpropionate dioxygenase-like ring-hydroxylating dioxygenase large terminal subunit
MNKLEISQEPSSSYSPPLTEFRQPPREAWYCVHSTRPIACGETVAVSVMDERIIVGRSKEGTLFALRDRCPHRGTPLSKGKFDGSALTCPFHGWRFNTHGYCISMPALTSKDDVEPQKISVVSFPVEEKDGLVWVYMGKQTKLAPPIPSLATKKKQRSRVVVSVLAEASFDLTVLSLIDPAHVGYVHNAWWWRLTSTARLKTKDFVPLPFGFRMSAHTSSANSRGYNLLGQPQTEVDFILPGQRIERIDMGQHSIINATLATPVDKNRTLMTNILVSDMPLLSLLSWPVARLATAFLRQDQYILELAQAGLDRKPTMVFLGEADQLAQWYFRLKRDYAYSQECGEFFTNPLDPQQLSWRT